MIFTTTCQKCKQETKPIYKTEDELPLDYDTGFFCQHCSLERLDTDSMLADLINTLEKAVDAAQKASHTASVVSYKQNIKPNTKVRRKDAK